MLTRRLRQNREEGEIETEQEETSKGDGETYNFTFVSPLVSHEYWIAVENGIQDYLHVKDSLMSIRLIDAIQESGRSGKTVEV